MLTSHPSATLQKRDLHVGGLGANAAGALAAVTGPARELTDTWFERLKDAASDTDDYVHGNPWAALALVAVVGLAAGYLLARRS